MIATWSRVGWIAVLALAGSVTLFAGASRAQAHAEPNEIRPGDGSVVTTVPVAVEIVMTQELARQPGANDIDVVTADGVEVTTETATLDLKDRRRLSVPLPGDLAPGAYIVRWKSLSAEDGDAEEGELSFTYDPSGVAAPGREQLDDEPAAAATVPVSANEDSSAFSTERQSTRGTWVAATAAAIAGLAIGGALSFLLVQRRAGPPA